ncbi:chymotrypsin-like elastase family member 2B [Pygocentrus nattereri]|uniref:chymotrypsin-like elastase family member 2B n=1 Tax=Pygocentrus nattereri TaxID=42514 RepID=UPI001891C5C4|nr:chymotrypsin-like elastase family member 2B [Pygocentrus nattereri]
MEQRLSLTPGHGRCPCSLLTPDVWQMCLGKHHLSASLDGPPEMCVSVAAIISHEGFVNPDAINDIALLRLAEPITNTPEISPLSLPKPEALMPAGHICYVTSWGDKKGTLKPVASRV